MEADEAPDVVPMEADAGDATPAKKTPKAPPLSAQAESILTEIFSIQEVFSKAEVEAIATKVKGHFHRSPALNSCR